MMPDDCASFCRKPLAAASCGLALALLFLAVPVDARERHGHAVSQARAQHERVHLRRSVRQAPRVRLHRRAAVDPQDTAAIVVDVNAWRTLYARNANELRHPASITKVMTLYLLFEQLESGRLRLGSTIPISSRAASQPPTKLGLRPGDSISVENAIKAVVTRSANDVAVAIAEAIGGDEESFAGMMTRKAHALGMARTHFANASGLPHDEQVTTARDLALLGRAVQDHFPRYYRYFATRTFAYKGAEIRNHNHLLERVEGMDGIKTGYTRASGFNLLASVRRDGHHIVAVVLGGRSAANRDRIMAELIEDQIMAGARTRMAGPLPLPAGGVGTTIAARASVAPVSAKVVPEHPVAPHPVAPLPDLELPFVPVSLRPGLTVDTAPLRAGGLAAAPAERPRPAYVAGAPRPRPEGAVLTPAEAIPPRSALDGSTRGPASASLSDVTATPSSVRRVRALVPPEDIAGAKATVARQQSPASAIDPRLPPAPRGAWMIQIAATSDRAKANDLLARAKAEASRALGGAEPTTEKVQKGSETLYRARFVGLAPAAAQSACNTLKRSGFSCFAAKN
jgi:D-alanyl-D-alanine carboxypeptidase